MDYVGETLGLKVSYAPWAFMSSMPYFIADRYGIRRASFGQADVLVLTLKADFPPVNALQKHIARIQKSEHLPVVIELESISKYRRDALIKAGIPFVVPGKQLYLPFLGAVLNERCDAEVQAAEKLLPSAQVLFFYYLYKKKSTVYIRDAVKDLRYSAMSVSRAARQLVQTGLFEECKEGVQKLLIAKYSKKEMFSRMRPLLINPVKRKIYIAREKVPANCPLAGFSAMAQYSMLNVPAVSCYAADGHAKLTGASTLIDEREQAEVEIWKYDPAVLSTGNRVDPLSLILSLQEDMDERTEEAVEELLEKFWEE